MIKWLEKITKEGAIVYPLIEMDEVKHESFIKQANQVRYDQQHKGVDLEYFTVKRLVSMQANTQKCPICETKINYLYGKGCLPNNCAFDRFDNTKGYIKGNVNLVCYKCNTQKEMDF